MNKKMLLYRIPRTLALVFIGFLAIFALDVFIPGQAIGYYIVALFMHLMPNMVLVILLAIAWKYETVGGTLFLIAGIFFTIAFKTYEISINFFIISFPLFVVGFLFIYNGKAHHE